MTCHKTNQPTNQPKEKPSFLLHENYNRYSKYNSTIGESNFFHYRILYLHQNWFHIVTSHKLKPGCNAHKTGTSGGDSLFHISDDWIIIWKIVVTMWKNNALYIVEILNYSFSEN